MPYEILELFDEQPSLKPLGKYEILERFDEEPIGEKENSQYNFSEETWPEYGARQLGRGASRIAESVGGLPGSIYGTLKSLPETSKSALESLVPGGPIPAKIIKTVAGTIGEQLPTPESIKGHIAKLAPENYFEPQDIVERGIDELATEVPRIAVDILTGGASATPRFLGKIASRVAPGFITSELGGGPLMQTIANLVGAGGFEAWAHKKSGMNLIKFAEDTEQAQYKLADKQAQKIYLQGEPLQRSIDKLAKDIRQGGTGMESTAIKRVTQEVNDINKIINKTGTKVGQINLRRAIKQKKHINALIKDRLEKSGSETEVNWLKRINGTLNEQIEKAEKANLDFGKPYRRAETLAENLGTIKETDDYMKSIMENPLFSKFKPGKLKRLFTWGVKRKPSRDVIHFFKKNKPELQEYAALAFDAAMKRDEQGVKRYLDLLKKFGMDI
jgi:hypothetical protein